LKADGSNFREWANHVTCKIFQAGGRIYLESTTRSDRWDLDKDLTMAAYIEDKVDPSLLMYVEISQAECATNVGLTNYIFNRIKTVFLKEARNLSDYRIWCTPIPMFSWFGPIPTRIVYTNIK
jgi:hypothetical protein